MKFGRNVKILWSDTKRWCGMPITFTKYYLVKKEGEFIKLIMERGFLHTEIEETNAYRIDDVSVYQSLSNKIFGVGNVEVYCKDASTNKIIITRVKDPFQLRSLINDLVEEDRKRRKITQAEIQY